MAPPKARRVLHQRRVKQVANRPNPIGNSKRHSWRAAQTFMRAAKNLVAEIKEPAN
jgi:hypothetical protein